MSERVLNMTELMRTGKSAVARTPVPTVRDPLAEAIRASSEPTAAESNAVDEALSRLRVQDRAKALRQEQKARDLLALNGSRAVDGAAFLTEEAEAEPVWGSGDQVLMAKGEGLMICGPQGVGKSTVVQQLVLARMGLRDPNLFGLPVLTDPRPILYLAMDRPPQIRRSLNRMVNLADSTVEQTLRDRLVVWKGPPPMDAAQAPQVFADWVLQIGREPGLVVVDSLKDLVSAPSDDAAGAGVNSAMQQILVNGAEYVDLHHQRKANADNRKPDKLSDVYGSTWLTAGKGSVVLLWGQPGARKVELSHLKQPMERVGPLIVEHTHGAGASVSTDPTDQIRQLAIVGGIEGVTEAACVRAIYDAGADDENYRAHKASVRRRLDKLARDGELQHFPGAKGGNGGGGRAAIWVYATAEK